MASAVSRCRFSSQLSVNPVLRPGGFALQERVARTLHREFRMATNSDQADPMLEQLFLRRAMQGDEHAFVALASMHCGKVYLTARNLCSSDVEALELIERALQSAWDQIGAMPVDLSFRVFVSRFVVKDAVERLRHSTPPVFTSVDQFVSVMSGGKRLTPSWQGLQDLERLAERPDIAERLSEALVLLDPEDRAAFVLRFVDAAPIDDAAAILELPIPIVRRRTHRACLLVSAYLSNLAADVGTV